MKFRSRALSRYSDVRYEWGGSDGVKLSDHVAKSFELNAAENIQSTTQQSPFLTESDVRNTAMDASECECLHGQNWLSCLSNW